MTETSAESFKRAIILLPMGGMTSRIACGMTIFVSAWPRLMPSVRAASICPLSTAMMAVWISSEL